MEYTEQQKQEFKNRFAMRRRKQLIVSGPIIILILLLVTANKNTGLILGTIPTAIFAPVFIAVLLGALIFSFSNWRCPACNKYLGKALNPRFCSKCGVGLR